MVKRSLLMTLRRAREITSRDKRPGRVLLLCGQTEIQGSANCWQRETQQDVGSYMASPTGFERGCGPDFRRILNAA